MILIVLKANIRPEKRDEWLTGIKDYTANVRQEPGNISFDYHENLEKPNEFVIVEVFADSAAGEAHVGYDHVKEFFPFMSTVVAERPRINYQDIDGDAWNEMAEVTPQ